MAAQIENELSIGLATPAPEVLLTPNIGVIGVGGAGGNAINNMIQSGLTGVSFFAANTDAQALTRSLVADKIQLGAAITKGLGAGANPEVGKAAAEESAEKIKEALTGLHLLFLTAGMGGGTGTGAAPVVAKIAKEMNILTVGVVSKPFNFEGTKRMRVAEQGIIELQKYVDTLVVVPNQNLFRIAGEKMNFMEGFKIADNVLCQGVRSITDLIMKPGLINLDFADVKTVLSTMGRSMMGTGEASGENRALEAAEKAITNPLLDNTSIKGAKSLLLNISSSNDITVNEFDTAAERVRAEVDPDATIIVGVSIDEELAGKVRVSIVATGIDDLVSGTPEATIVPQPKPVEKTVEITPPSPVIPPVQEEKTEPEPELIQNVEEAIKSPVAMPEVAQIPPDLVIHLDKMEPKTEPDLIGMPTPPSMPEAVPLDEIPEEKEDIEVEPRNTEANVKATPKSFWDNLLRPIVKRPPKQQSKKEQTRERTFWEELDDLDKDFDLPSCLMPPRK